MRQQYAVTVSFTVEKQILVFGVNETEARLNGLAMLAHGGPHMVIDERVAKSEVIPVPKDAKTVIYCS